MKKSWPSFHEPSPNQQYNFSTTQTSNRPLRILIIIGLLFMVGFVAVYFQPENRGYSWLYVLLTISVVFKLLRLLHEWYHYWYIVPKAKPAATRTWTVDVLTTYCPGEPRDMVLNTLRAIQAMPYPHTTYLCDEANDPELKQACERMGVRHVTRAVKTDAKAGNINNALEQATGEICLVIDPDHVPVPDFLDQVLPYFEDTSIGFVQCVQGYYNRKESVVAFGAAEQTYSFYGPMMTCMGHYGTAQAIGANCTFRRSALDSIGGHANGLSEDMHTAMKLHAQGWQSAYVPMPLSYGLVPSTLSAYYKQQLKWARGTFELLFTTLPVLFGQLTNRQRLHYGTLPLYYLLGVVQLFDLIIPIASLIMMRLPLHIDLFLFGTAYIPLILTGFLIRQYTQRWLIEKHEAGFHLLGGLLASGTWWVYTLGLLYTLLRIKVPYIPTPKDDRPRNNFLLVLPNLLISSITLAAIGYSIYWYGRFTLNNIYSQLMIGFGLLNILIMSLNVLIGQEKLLASIASRINRLSINKPLFYWKMRLTTLKARYGLYYWLRWSAIPLAGAVLLVAAGLTFTYQKKLEHLPVTIRNGNTQPFYIGLASPGQLPRHNTNMPFLVPYHLKWPVSNQSAITLPNLHSSINQLPLFYLEPVGELDKEEKTIRQFLEEIVRGERDQALVNLVRVTKQYQQPILISFMPEFDNVAKPWGMKQSKNLALFQRAWQYVVQFCQARGTDNIAWVWCPSQPSSLAKLYPGNERVDWVGLSVVDNPALASDGQSHSFGALFQLAHMTVRNHEAYSMRQKPILLTSLTPLESNPSAQDWMDDAIDMIQERYPQVRGILFPDKKSLASHYNELMQPKETD